MTRQEALRTGSKTYTGRPCKQGHPSGLRFLGTRTCVECTRERMRRWRAANPEKKLAESYAWRAKNPDLYRSYQRKSKRKYMRERRARDLAFRLKHVLRCRLNKVVRGECKSVSAVRDLGCSIDEFRQHIESQFRPGMTWETYGRGGWELDHIEPFAAFDLSDPEQQKRAVHFSNLQPLWAAENLSKRAVDKARRVNQFQRLS